MQDLSFSFPTPRISFGGFTFSVLIYTFSNVYAPDGGIMNIRREGDMILAETERLRYAGGQMELPGEQKSKRRYVKGAYVFQLPLKYLTAAKISVV